MSLGKMIKYLRVKNNMTQEELGVILGVKKSAVQKYESGAIRNLRIDSVRALCDHFHVTPWIIIYSDKFLKLIESKQNVPIKMYTMDESFTLFDAVDFFELYFSLTFQAREKINDYIEDLLKIPEYHVRKIID